jgi:hypothetical protein
MGQTQIRENVFSYLALYTTSRIERSNFVKSLSRMGYSVLHGELGICNYNGER